MFRGARLALVDQEAEPMTSSPPSVAAIAAGVARTAKHERAELALAEARAKRANLRRETATLATAAMAQSGTTASVRRRADAMQKEAEAIEAEIGAARQAVAPLRAAHREAVRVALAVRTREAGAAILAALDTLRAAALTLDEVDDALVRAGGGERRYLSLPDMGRIEIAARRAVGR